MRSVPPGFGCCAQPGTDQSTSATRLHHTSRRMFIGASFYSGLTKSRGFAWPQVLCTGPVGIFSVVSRFDALERKCEKSLGVEVQIVRQPARRSDGFAIPRPDGLRFADRRNRL